MIERICKNCRNWIETDNDKAYQSCPRAKCKALIMRYECLFRTGDNEHQETEHPRTWHLFSCSEFEESHDDAEESLS